MRISWLLRDLPICKSVEAFFTMTNPRSHPSYIQRRCLVGLDIGRSNIGVAVSDNLQAQAIPWGTIRRGPYGKLKDEKSFKALFSKLDYVGTVVGMPLTLDGKFGEQAEFTAACLRMLGQCVDFKHVLLQDERFSTQYAVLSDQFSTSNQAYCNKDSLAAVEILQDYLEQARNRQDGTFTRHQVDISNMRNTGNARNRRNARSTRNAGNSGDSGN